MLLDDDSALTNHAQFFIELAQRKNMLSKAVPVVLDVQTGEVLALANYPSFVPDKRRNLSGAQLRNRPRQQDQVRVVPIEVEGAPEPAEPPVRRVAHGCGGRHGVFQAAFSHLKQMLR